jgi:glycosyltransferase involved in cell wall biosynthesis
MRGSILASATHLLACSIPAAGCLFGADWRRHWRAKLVYCGVDFAPFAASDRTADRAAVRQEFGIGPAEIVVGHVGRFDAGKNHAFLCTVAARAMRREPRICVLCIGVGPLSDRVKAHFEQAGVRAIMTGRRADVPRLLHAMDVFAFPSVHEGLPLAVVEAQAAGLPCVVSDAVTQEVDVVHGLIRWLPLSAGAGVWADAVLQAAGQPAQSAAALAAMRRSPFSVETSFERMRSIYCA